MPGGNAPAAATLTTALAIFLLYTNLPVVVGERGVPSIVVFSVPLLLSVAVAYQTVIRRRPIVVDRTFFAMMGFFAVLLASTFAVEGYAVALRRMAAFVGEGLIIYFLVRNAIRSLPEIRVAVLAVLTAATLLSGLSVAQAVTGDYRQDYLGLASRDLELVDTRGSTPADVVGLEDRAGGPVGEPNRFAQILLMALPLAAVAGLNAPTRRGAVVALASVALILAGVLLTYSRGALLTMVVLLFLAAPLRLIRPSRLVGVLVAGVVVTIAAVPGITGRVGSIAGVADLFGSSQVEADGPTRGRATEMLAALAAYTDHPVLGVGPGQYFAYHSVRYQSLPEISIRELPTPRRAHSLYLEVAAETGTAGLLIFLAIPLWLLLDLERLRRVLRSRRPDLARLAAGFTLVLLAYLGTGVFLHLAYERYFWVMVALTAATVGVLDAWIRDHSVVTHHSVGTT